MREWPIAVKSKKGQEEERGQQQLQHRLCKLPQISLAVPLTLDLRKSLGPQKISRLTGKHNPLMSIWWQNNERG